MHHFLVAYTTFDRHTAKIAEHIADTLRNAATATEVCDVAQSAPSRPLREYAGVIAGGPLHGEKRSLHLVRFVADHVEELNQQPSAFFSVSLSAAGTTEQKADAWRCVQQFLQSTRWRPVETVILAGALLYRKYGFFKRWLMKLIVKRAGGDTDTSRDFEYTDWTEVERFATAFKVRVTGSAERGAADSRAG